ncbi:hypothetical protein FOA43_003485 [Brettanomyces nanus]|uniref:Uncharacterized protein n=1 Tax=Eeniella nana TaxID=13502 RepID=A0A875S8V3_EENNA|nr:uncharacterized protein FOA43_003485 [Brettanomyces nanus]QPG76099.1 hypothetical protein FOA43_003485 [Brettanomyces nanus]
MATSSPNKEKINASVPKPTHSILRKTNGGVIDHLALSESLGYHIFRKSKRRTWSITEDNILKDAVIDSFLENEHLEKYNKEDIKVEKINWSRISSKLPSRKPKECRKRWTSSLNPCLRKGKWTSGEDAQLITAYKQYGSSWQKVASEIHGRNEDQCAKRYTEVLNTSTEDRLKQWNMDEDLKLIHGVRKYGTKWRMISKTISGRPSLTCRNRWRRIMTDVGRNSASKDIMKAVGVLDSKGNPLFTFVSGDGNTDSDKREIKKRKADQDQSEVAFEEKSDHTVGSTSGFTHGVSVSGSPSYNSPTSTSSSSSTPAMNFMGHRITQPSRSYTEWRFALMNPRTNEEVSQFSGPIATQDLAHRLIELAKYNGVSLTIHQHIHHHYSPSSPVLDPQASVTRFSHFNYLPPLTEVPKLTSSSPENVGSPNSSHRTPGSAAGESSLLRLLNTDKAEYQGTVHDGSMTEDDPESSDLVPERQQLASSQQQQQQQQQQKQGREQDQVSSVLPVLHPALSSSRQISKDLPDVGFHHTRSNSANEKVNPIKFGRINGLKGYIDGVDSANGDDVDEEVDFWETLQSIAHPKPQSGRPVSQHHPLHYFEAAESGPFSPNGVNNQAVTSGNANEGTDASNGSTNQGRDNNTRAKVGTIENKFGDLYSNEVEEEEEMESYANQYGMYYNVFANKGGAASSKGPGTDNSSFGYVMPFNPS